MENTLYKKHKFIILAVFIAFAAFSAANAETPEAQSDKIAGNEEAAALENLLLLAEQKNPLLRAAEERIKHADSALSEAVGRMGPSVVAGAGALWNKDDPFLPVMSPLTGLIGYVPLGFRNTYAAAISFSQTLYAGGSLTSSRDAAKLALAATVAEALRTYQSVNNSVRAAYFNLRRAEEKERVAEEAAELAGEHLKRAETLFAAGVVAKNDVLRSRVAVADAELALIRARNAIELAVTSIERATGTAITYHNLKQGEERAENKLSEPLGGLEKAYFSRAELRMYSLLSRQAEKIARAEQGQLLPQIILKGSLSNTDSEFFPNKNEEWRISLVMYWTLFDSGQAAARTKQARARAAELLYNLEDMKNTIKMEVTQAELNLKSAKSRLSVAERQVAESEEDYRIAVKRYEALVGTNLDMLDARLALTSSRTELADAIYDIEIAKADLIYAMGEDLPRGHLAGDMERAKIYE